MSFKPRTHGPNEKKRRADVVNRFELDPIQYNDRRFKQRQEKSRANRKKAQQKMRRKLQEQQQLAIPNNESADSRELNGESTNGVSESDRKTDDVFIDNLSRDLKTEMDQAVSGLDKL